MCRNCYALHRVHQRDDVKARIREIKRRSYVKHAEARKAYAKGYSVKNSDRVYLRHVKKSYRLSSADHAALLEIQEGRCAICHTHQDQLDTRLCVDHSHDTGEVRGLLCRGCNTMLGYHEKRKTGAWSHYMAFPPMKELKYRRETPIDEQVHPY